MLCRPKLLNVDVKVLVLALAKRVPITDLTGRAVARFLHGMHSAALPMSVWSKHESW